MKVLFSGDRKEKRDIQHQNESAAFDLLWFRFEDDLGYVVHLDVDQICWNYFKYARHAKSAKETNVDVKLAMLYFIGMLLIIAYFEAILIEYLDQKYLMYLQLLLS